MRKREVLASVAFGITAGLAGCSGDDGGTDDEETDGTDGTESPDDSDGDDMDGESDGSDDNTVDDGTDDGTDGTDGSDDDTDDETDGEDDSEESRALPTGSVRTNPIEELEITNWTAEFGESFGDTELYVDVTVQNTGEETIDSWEGYTLKTFYYDESGTELDFDEEPARGAFAVREIPPGDTISVAFERGPADDSDAHPDDVASYEITLDCSESYDPGSYCP